MARQRNESTLEILFALPWWVSGMLAGSTLFSPEILSLMFPLEQGQAGSMVGTAIVTVAENVSPYVAAFLFLLALIVFAKDMFNSRRAAHTPWPAQQSSAPNARPNRKKANEATLESKVEEPDWAYKDVTDTAGEKAISWSLEMLQSLDWKRFEELSAALFSDMNLVTRNTRLGADGGIDIELYDKEAPDTLVAIAQCKAWSNPVGVRHVREFYGVMMATKVSRAYFVTTSTFTDDAVSFSKLTEVSLIDGFKFIKLIQSRSPEKSAELLKLATAGDYTTPTCPGCGLKMVTREASNTGQAFWGCKSYPRCKGKLNMKKDNICLKLKRTLPPPQKK